MAGTLLQNIHLTCLASFLRYRRPFTLLSIFLIFIDCLFAIESQLSRQNHRSQMMRLGVSLAPQIRLKTGSSLYWTMLRCSALKKTRESRPLILRRCKPTIITRRLAAWCKWLMTSQRWAAWCNRCKAKKRARCWLPTWAQARWTPRRPSSGVELQMTAPTIWTI